MRTELVSVIRGMMYLTNKYPKSRLYKRLYKNVHDLFFNGKSNEFVTRNISFIHARRLILEQIEKERLLKNKNV